MTVTTRQETIRVILVDDHALVREGLRAVLTAEPDVEIVAEATNAEAAVAAALREKPDVVLLDIRLPDQDGIEVTKRLRENLPDTAVVLLTMHENRGLARRGLEAGAVGYLLKDSPAPLIRLAIRAVMQEGAVLHHRVLRDLILGTAPEPEVPENGHGHRLPALSDREMDVLRQVADGKSNRKIAETMHLSESTVKKYIQSLLAKLQVADRTEAAVTALRSGLLR